MICASDPEIALSAGSGANAYTQAMENPLKPATDTLHPVKGYSAAADIARLERLITQLPGGARVSVDVNDGSRYTGYVTVRPSIQALVDANGVEGLNARLRLDDPLAPEWSPTFWVGDITHVQVLSVR